MTWPRSRGGRPADADGRRHAPAPARRPSLLLVEDDPSAVGLLRAYLEPAGYRVRAGDRPASRPSTMPGRDRPTAILLDVLLPSIDGWEVLRRLKGDPACATSRS